MAGPAEALTPTLFRVADRGVELLRVAGDDLRLVEAVDDAPRILPVLDSRREIVREFPAREPAPLHAAEHDRHRVRELEDEIGIGNAIDAEFLLHLFVVVFPGQLHEAP